MHQTIIQAINERRLLSIEYPPGARIVEPCCYGTSSERNDLLRAFQTSGASASGEHINWKLMRMDRIISVRMLDEVFAGPRPEYRRNDKAMKGEIYCQL